MTIALVSSAAAGWARAADRRFIAIAADAATPADWARNVRRVVDMGEGSAGARRTSRRAGRAGDGDGACRPEWKVENRPSPSFRTGTVRLRLLRERPLWVFLWICTLRARSPRSAGRGSRGVRRRAGAVSPLARGPARGSL